MQPIKAKKHSFTISNLSEIASFQLDTVVNSHNRLPKISTPKMWYPHSFFGIAN
jgi:hypothetical protein